MLLHLLLLLTLALTLPATLAAPVVVADIPSTLRLATPSEIPDLLTATRHPLSPTTHDAVANMGFPQPFSPSFLGTTSHNRLVFTAPRFHGLAYLIPHHTFPYSEYLVVLKPESEGGSGVVRSYGWEKGTRWNMGVRRDIAVELGEGKWLMADNVPVGGFAVVRAPWLGGGKEEGDYKVLGDGWAVEEGVRERYEGPVTE